MRPRLNSYKTRRDFLRSTAALTATALLSGRVEAEPSEVPQAKLAADPMRPQYHLLPARNWMNDPNGPIYFDGRYHMFFQYNPHAAVWGDMSWGHAVSEDMMHWTHLPVAMTPTPNGPDSFGCFSGSAIAVGSRVYFVYTGVRESTPDKVTIHDGSDKLQESQCLAFCDTETDPRLLRWTKRAEPIVAEPPTGLKITGFRDPSVWKQGSWFYMTVGSGIARTGGVVLLYRSKDLTNWEYLHVLTSGAWTGRPATNPCDSGEMWECPELFALDKGHVLIYSTEGKVFWQSGTLDEERMIFRPVKTGELDLGAFYAPKTQLDASGRRILWCWIPERRPEQQLRAAGWAGMMSLPRVLRLDNDGGLRMQMLSGFASLRGAAIEGQVVAASGEQRFVLRQANGELLSRPASGQGFELTMTYGGDSTTLLHLSYSPEKQRVTLDGTEIGPVLKGVAQVHIFVDGSVIELIVDEQVACTRRFYYASTVAPDINVRIAGRGTVTNAWAVRPISDDRLTTASS